MQRVTIDVGRYFAGSFTDDRGFTMHAEPRSPSRTRLRLLMALCGPSVIESMCPLQRIDAPRELDWLGYTGRRAAQFAAGHVVSAASRPIFDP
jgi:hypothetical protein